MISSNMNTTNISLLNTAVNTLFPVGGYFGASARIGCTICFSEVYLLLFFPVSNWQKGFSNSVHLFPCQNLFKCKIYFSYFEKMHVTSPLPIEIQNQSTLGNQCQGAKTSGRNKWETLLAWFQNQTSQARNIHHYNYSKKLKTQMEAYGWLISWKPILFILKNGDEVAK